MKKLQEDVSLKRKQDDMDEDVALSSDLSQPPGSSSEFLQVADSVFKLSYIALLLLIPYILPLLLLTGFWKVAKCSTEAAAVQSHCCVHAKKFLDGVKEKSKFMQ